MKFLTSYDVTAIFTSVQVDGALEDVKELLQKDNSWKSRTYLNALQIIALLEFRLTTTYFMFRGQSYQQDRGCAMGLPVSPIIANFYMENFEVKAIISASQPRTRVSGCDMLATLSLVLGEITHNSSLMTLTAWILTSTSQIIPKRKRLYHFRHFGKTPRW